MTWVFTTYGRDRDQALTHLRRFRPDAVVAHVYPVHWSAWIEGQPLADYLIAMVCPARRWWRIVFREPSRTPTTLVPA